MFFERVKKVKQQDHSLLNSKIRLQKKNILKELLVKNSP